MKKIFYITVILLACMALLCSCESKEVLDTPSNVRVTEDEFLIWDAVDGADEYTVITPEREYKVTETSFDISAITVKLDEVYEFTVCAQTSDNSVEASLESSKVEYSVRPQDDALAFTLIKKNASIEYDHYIVGVKDPSKISGKLIIPSEYNGVPVVAVQNYDTNGKDEISAFNECKNLSGVVISEGVQSVYLAFNDCDSLRYVNLPESLETLAGFNNCPKLKEIYVPGNVRRIFDSFEGCDDIIVSHDEASEYLIYEGNCFISKENAELLLMVNTNVVPSSVEIISSVRSNAEHIILSEGVKSIDQAAFRNLKNLKRITLPSSLEKIGDFAFAGCDNLESVELPMNLKSIGKRAFSGCDKITKLVLHPSLNEISESAFENMDGLVDISFSSESEYYKIENGAVVKK